MHRDGQLASARTWVAPIPFFAQTGARGVLVLRCLAP
jgi:hypothetical protein